MAKLKYVLITGATSGIGEALALQFAAQKHNLILASRNSAKMTKLKELLQNTYQIKVATLTIDLAQPNAAQELFEWCNQQQLVVDILINNAGVGLHPLKQVDQPLTETEQLMNLNMVTPAKLATLFGKKMKMRKYGYIMNIASTAAFQPMPFAALYGASKAFLLSLSEAMTVELSSYNVGVTAVCPGITDTNFFKYGKPNVPGWLYKLVPAHLVARRAIKAMYRKKLYVIPYLQHWLIAQISRFLSRKTVVKIMQKVETKRKSLKKT